ncbi:MAG: hypothetical protein LBC75_00965 [Fibromonadaceae bacterium]|nr:hypothetical protein [Fibromonadaceae bacterium]
MEPTRFQLALSSTVLGRAFNKRFLGELDMRKVAKYELCSSCRNIIMYDDRTVENFLDGEGYSSPFLYMMMNHSVLQMLQEKGGCSHCINLFAQASR